MESGKELDALIAEKVMGHDKIGYMSIDDFLSSFSIRTRNCLERAAEEGGYKLDKSRFQSFSGLRALSDEQYLVLQSFGTVSLLEVRRKLEEVQESPAYSTTWEGMGLVVEKMKQDNFSFKLRWSVFGGGYTVDFVCSNGPC